ncbi:MAG: hypothetical protein IMF15_04060, partial [Proteobacteria bacterium]|nr:hypothetical protein [Pseudomonadota bacterium]
MTEINNDSNKETGKKIPLWVMLAFSSIHKRKHALILIGVSVLFTLYCLPFSSFSDNEIISTIFLIDDWSWIAIMIPICIWYILCL